MGTFNVAVAAYIFEQLHEYFLPLYKTKPGALDTMYIDLYLFSNRYSHLIMTPDVLCCTSLPGIWVRDFTFEPPLG